MTHKTRDPRFLTPPPLPLSAGEIVGHTSMLVLQGVSLVTLFAYAPFWVALGATLVLGVPAILANVALLTD